MKAEWKTIVATVILWLARAMAVCVFLFWGAFFVEHVQEWFIHSFPRHPPLKICMGMGLHFLMLLGLVLALRWERLGGLLVVVSAFLFFVDKAGSRFPLFFGLTVLPAALLLLCRWLRAVR